jgi:hypothetical protein
MKIKIGIWTMSDIISVSSDSETKEFNINGQDLPFSENFLRSSISLVKDWEERVEDLQHHDGVIYKISYNDGQEERVLTGNNKTPENFSVLTSLIASYTPKTKEQLEDDDWNKFLNERRKQEFREREGME